MKYKSITEILESEELSLTEMQEEMEKYIKSKGMTSEEFMTTSEGQAMTEIAERRFWMPTHEEKNKESNQK